ncbi:MAG: copper resistance protein B [Sphingomonas sp.]
MNRLLAALAATSALALAMPVTAQDMPGMPGMKMPAPAKKPPAPKAAPRKPAVRKTVRKPAAHHAPTRHAAPAPAAMPETHDSMPGMTMPAKPDASTPEATQSMPGMDMSGVHDGHDMSAKPAMAQTGTALPAGNAPAPPPPMDHYADRFFPTSEMEPARTAMMREPGQALYQVMFNLAEYQAHSGRDGYRWDGEAFVGGDINRLWLKSEGEGSFREGIESAEIQALYSRAIDPYFNLQAGLRHDFKPGPSRTYATIGLEGLAPYRVEVQGALFLSDKGDLLGRLEGYYDQRITQRLILQPRVELNLSAQDMPANRLGSGLTDAELGLRLRYEISRQFAPYIGVSCDAKAGRTADFARADGKDPTTTSFVAGVRFWF